MCPAAAERTDKTLGPAAGSEIGVAFRIGAEAFREIKAASPLGVSHVISLAGADDNLWG